MDYIILGTHII